MTCGIYKITNKINNKCYIGQSVNVHKRWSVHKNPNKWEDLPLARAFKKYGIENFSFEVIEETNSNSLNEKERFYIKKYKAANSEFGYNLTLGGNSIASLEQESRANEIKLLLKTTKISQSDIAKKFNIHHQTISDINRGVTWFDSNEIYPIREMRINYSCEDCGVEIGIGSKRCSPCHSKSIRTVERPNPIILQEEITSLGFSGTGRKYGVSGSAIKKWCISYGMSKYIKDYK